MPIMVDFYDEVIYITSPTTSVTVQELLNAIRTAEDTPEGMSFGGIVGTVSDGICDSSGKGDLGDGYLETITLTLHSDWYIEFWDGVVLGKTLGGNIIGGLGSRPVRAASGSGDTAYQLGAQFGTIAETGVSGLTSGESTQLTNIDTRTQFQDKILKNKRSLVKESNVWYLKVYDDNGTDVILKKALKDLNDNEIADLSEGALSTEIANSA
jgi:hypothetical protein